MSDTAAPALPANEIAAAAAILRAGGIGIFPTDTVYGVGAHAFIESAVRRIYAIKDRPADKPLQLLLARVGDIESVAEVTPAARALAARFLPGGLTLVLRRRPIVPDVVTAGGDTVAVRVPDSPLLQRLIEEVGAPLAATSANRSGEPPPVEASDARAQLGGLVDFVVDGGRCPAAQESTIVDLSGPEPRLLRPGAVPAEEIEAVLGHELRPR